MKTRNAATRKPKGNGRAIGYFRVSTPRQAKHEVSLEDQKNKVVDRCANDDNELAETFTDRGLTARNDSRPEFQKMIAYALDPANNISSVYVYSMSRFVRNPRDFFN
jgi:DNA invertase Pin-like site-specific DNA recombinase